VNDKTLSQYEKDVQVFNWSHKKSSQYKKELIKLSGLLKANNNTVPLDRYLQKHLHIIFYVIKCKYNGKRYFMDAYFGPGSYKIMYIPPTPRKKHAIITDDLLDIKNINNRKISFLKVSDINKKLGKKYYKVKLKDITKDLGVIFFLPSFESVILALETKAEKGTIKADDIDIIHKDQVYLFKHNKPNIYQSIYKTYGHISGLAEYLGFKII